jgi:hypothetical protein
MRSALERNAMLEPPGGAPAFQSHRSAYRELMTGLWYAQELFKSEGDGGLEGAKAACRAVARFVAVRGENPELAGPFLALFGAFQDLEKGIEPELFSRGAPPKERSRSSQRKHVQLFAAAIMEILVRLGETLEDAARLVAAAVDKWPELARQTVTEATITAWRDRCRSVGDPRHQQFLQIRDHILGLPNPRAEVDRALGQGPPGSPS